MESHVHHHFPEHDGSKCKPCVSILLYNRRESRKKKQNPKARTLRLKGLIDYHKANYVPATLLID